MKMFWRDDLHTATLKKLRQMMDFNHVVRVTDDATSPIVDVHHSEAIHAPEIFEGRLEQRVVNGELVDSEWTLLTGYSGQMGTKSHDPGMHPSEFVGGRLARDILAEPGLYVSLPNVEADEWYVAHRSECWHVGRNTPGYMPQEPAICFGSWSEAVESLESQMLDFGQEDDKRHEEEGNEESDPPATYALVRDTLFGVDHTIFKPGIVDHSLRLNDDTRENFFIHPMSGCDHEGCDHDEYNFGKGEINFIVTSCDSQFGHYFDHLDLIDSEDTRKGEYVTCRYCDGRFICIPDVDAIDPGEMREARREPRRNDGVPCIQVHGKYQASDGSEPSECPRMSMWHGEAPCQAGNGNGCPDSQDGDCKHIATQRGCNCVLCTS